MVGLGLSKAAADYLGVTGPRASVQWRPVDDGNVAPGRWLQGEERSVLMTAIRESDAAKGGSAPAPTDLAKLRSHYLAMYVSLGEAENNQRKGHIQEAAAGFTNAQKEPQLIQTTAPSWERVLVMSRLVDVRLALTSLEGQFHNGVH
jgi:hypothetical protein